MNKEHFYRTVGELLYVVAMADDAIQPEESEALQNILNDHPYAEVIQWSFNYEAEKESDIDLLYRKVVEIFKDHGPSEDYDFVISALERVAAASDGINGTEQRVIHRFSTDLIERFKEDLRED
ncbi:TerB family tellurite resistance protein [Sungkyunkwania multivorans]|uniref:TerB family tellurite resistance protein n=1 Tax=Sungkyunkwania multivorans TaxID=1173618 RepID=A0ABW3D1V8_9FLAO